MTACNVRETELSVTLQLFSALQNLTVSFSLCLTVWLQHYCFGSQRSQSRLQQAAVFK